VLCRKVHRITDALREDSFSEYLNSYGGRYDNGIPVQATASGKHLLLLQVIHLSDAGAMHGSAHSLRMHWPILDQQFAHLLDSFRLSWMHLLAQVSREGFKMHFTRQLWISPLSDALAFLKLSMSAGLPH